MLAPILALLLLAAASPPPGGTPAPLPSRRATIGPAPAAGKGPVRKPKAPTKPAPPRPTLAEVLQRALEAADLDGGLHDAGPIEGRCPGERDCPWPLPPAGVPWIDLAVIRLDADGRALEAANVQVDPSTHPHGRVVRLDRNLAATGVRFRRWSQARREGSLTAPFTDADDLSPARRSGVDFMAPYPASLFKLLLAFHVERRAALGKLALHEPIRDEPPPAAAGAPPAAPPEERLLSDWVERMITQSDNRATRVVLRHLHARGEVVRLNRDLADLGLDTLRVDGTLPDGGRWAPGEVHAGAMDVARLLWLVAGGPGVRWRTPGGVEVTSRSLPGPARRRLKALLADQGFHEALSSGSLCGSRRPGIPAQVPLRFVEPATGFEAAGEQAWRRDVRPCNAAAQVRFLHKTGLTWNFASDAGLVEPLPGKPYRRYVVAVVTSAGTRLVDADRAVAPRHPCDQEQSCVTGRLSTLGAFIDAWAVGASSPPPRR